MKKLVIGLAVALAGCASASPIYTADGRQGYSIDCSGTALTWGMCYEKAGEICQAKGYDLLVRDGQTGALMTTSSSGGFNANSSGAQGSYQSYGFGGTTMYRTLLIACKA